VNTVTISRELFADVTGACGHAASTADRAHAVAEIARRRGQAGGRPLTFAIVHPHSMHYYEVAYWLAAAGLAPERDYALAVLPPPLMADALASRQIDGFCVGEPWGSVAAARGSGAIIATKHEIWAAGPEKMLGMRADWAEANPQLLSALMRAIYRACEWCDEPGNAVALTELLALTGHLDQPAAVIGHALGLGADGSSPALRPRELHFAAQAATFPWVSHARWIYAQMVRLGQVRWAADHIDVVSASFRPDLYRAIIAPTGVAVPSANSKLEGTLDGPVAVATANGRLFLGPDRFFDGRQFDPEAIEAYIAQGAV
ncbi:MAG: ABC transporter substrate-binding protein, partial [Hyphomicrobiaceae bacterium]|nr:ABC transporter substrate-binding protein [Hyphomicrobiaceae bacterium]